MRHRYLRCCLLTVSLLAVLCQGGGSWLPRHTRVLRIACAAPAAVPIALPTGTVGQSYSATLDGDGGVAPYAFTLRSGTLPGGLTFADNGGTPGSATISGTPTQSANVTLAIEIRDVNGCLIVQEFTLLVNCTATTLPALTLATGTVGGVYPNTTITPTGGTAPYSFSVTGLPTGMTSTGGANLTLGGTPTQAGSFTVQVTATDAYGCPNPGATRSYALTIAKGTPVLTWNTPAAIGVGVPLSATQLNATANVAGVFSYTPPAGTTFNAGSYLLTANFVPNDPANFTAASQTVTLTVVNPCGIDLKPLTMPPAIFDKPFVQTLSASPTGSYTFSLASGSLPPDIKLVNTLGIYSLRGIPKTHGTYNFTLKARQNATGCEGVRMYTITVP